MDETGGAKLASAGSRPEGVWAPCERSPHEQMGVSVCPFFFDGGLCAVMHCLVGLGCRAPQAVNHGDAEVPILERVQGQLFTAHLTGHTAPKNKFAWGLITITMRISHVCFLRYFLESLHNCLRRVLDFCTLRAPVRHERLTMARRLPGYSESMQTSGNGLSVRE